MTEHTTRVTVELPAELVLCADVPAQALRLYAIMLLFCGPDRCCHMRRGELAKTARLSETTCRKYLAMLETAGYVTSLRAGKFAVIDPGETFWLGRLEQVKRRLARAQFLGEALMREWLTLLVVTDRYEDNARPGFMGNPQTDEKLEYDRYYPELGVAFEFNGPQHYTTTKMYPNSEEGRRLRMRDAIKSGLSHDNNVRLVIIEAKDLSLQGMLKKIGDLLPLLPGAEKSPVAAHLEKVSAAYRNKAHSYAENLGQ